MAIADIVKAITVTAELTGAQMSGAAIAVMAQDLTAQHSDEAIIRALTRCRRELSRPLTAGAVFDRLGESDGRPSADEAWALSIDAADEAKTVVWTNEAQQAFSLARPILDEGDKIGARMAFRDAYDRIVRNNREAGIQATWSASLGWDKDLRVSVLKKAESNGLLPAPQVASLLPHIGAGVIGDAIFNGKALPAPAEGGEDVARRVRLLLASMADQREAAEKEAAERNQAERDALAKRKQEIASQVQAAMKSKDAA